MWGGRGYTLTGCFLLKYINKFKIIGICLNIEFMALVGYRCEFTNLLS